MWKACGASCSRIQRTGECHSIEEFLAEAFGQVGLDWREFVESDSRYIRPAEVDLLLADASKARTKLGWEKKVTFGELVRIMVGADIESVGLKPPGEGFRSLEGKFALGTKWSNSVSANLQAVAGSANR